MGNKTKITVTRKLTDHEAEIDRISDRLLEKNNELFRRLAQGPKQNATDNEEFDNLIVDEDNNTIGGDYFYEPMPSNIAQTTPSKEPIKTSAIQPVELKVS